MSKYSNLFCTCARSNVLSFNTNKRAFHRTSGWSKAQILDGYTISKNICANLKLETQAWVGAGNVSPKLVALLVGEDPASVIYVRNKIRSAEEVGVACVKLSLPANITQNKLIEHIQNLNADKSVDGILVQLPLPRHIDERIICNSVMPEKDVDGLNVNNIGRLCLGLTGFVPCTVLGVQEIIKSAGIETLGKNAVVCGRSRHVGMPIAMLLHSDGHNGVTMAMDATTTVCHRYTPPERLAELTRNADIIIAAAGVPNMITADMVKEGACVIDIGFNRITNLSTGKTKLVGDVDYEAVQNIAGHITPVPGGVGPVTVAMLMKNTLLAAKKLIKFS